MKDTFRDTIVHSSEFSTSLVPISPLVTEMWRWALGEVTRIGEGKTCPNRFYFSSFLTGSALNFSIYNIDSIFQTSIIRGRFFVFEHKHARFHVRAGWVLTSWSMHIPLR